MTTVPESIGIVEQDLVEQNRVEQNRAEQDREVERLLATLSQEGKRRKPLIRRSIGLLGMFLFGLFLLLFLAIIVIELIAHRPTKQFLPGALLLLAIILGLNAFTGSSAQLQAARRLVEIPDKRAIGMLTDILHWHDRTLQEQAHKMLLRLLPQLDVGDANLLNRYQYFQLTQALHPVYADTRTDYVLAVLNAMERIGDARALPFVRTLTVMKTDSDARQQVKRAAERCLAAIQARRAPATPSAISAPGEANPLPGPVAYPIRRPKRLKRPTAGEGTEKRKTGETQKRRDRS